jgi:hypothetical protein
MSYSKDLKESLCTPAAEGGGQSHGELFYVGVGGRGGGGDRSCVNTQAAGCQVGFRWADPLRH